MESLEIGCETRPTRPKRLAKRLRRSGRVPAILYGPKTSPSAISLSANELSVVGHEATGQQLFRLKSSAPELNGRYVIFKEVQREPVSGKVVHADFYEVDLNRPVRVAVALRFTGRAAGVARGGILQPLVREVEVECLPLEIPDVVEVDVSALGIHDVIHVSTLKFAGNVRPIFDTDYPVVTVLPPTVAEAPPAAAAAEAAAAPAAAAPAEPSAPGPAATPPTSGKET